MADTDMQKLISIILPIYNEAEHIANTVSVMRAHLQDVNTKIEFILVDDGSSDDTWGEIKSLCEKHSDVKGLTFSKNFGKEYAMSAGLRHCNGDAAIILDADLQHPPNIIPDMIKLWQQHGAEIVNAVKSYRGQESHIQNLTTKTFYNVYRALIGVNLQGASDFKLLDRAVIDQYNSFKENALFFRGLVPWLGFTNKTIYFDVQERVAGHTKWSGFKRLMLAINAITSFSNTPLHIVTLTGVIFFLFSIILGTQTFIKWLGGDAIEGFTTIILLLLIIGSVLMFSLGVIGQYISKIYEEIKSRPRYIVKEQAGFKSNDKNR